MASTAGSMDTTRLLVVGTAAWIDPVTARLEDGEMDVQTAQSAASAREILADHAIDGVIVAARLSETTGVAFVRSVREDHGTLPVILCTDDGSGSLASDAIDAGVTDYVQLDSAQPSAESVATLSDRIRRRSQEAEQAATKHERARQFDAIFNDTETATWVLDPDGRLVRVNRTAREWLETDRQHEAILGRPFWQLPWWSGAEGLRSDLEQILDRTRDGSVGNAVILQPREHDAHGSGNETGGNETDTDTRVFDLSARPVVDDRGELASIVVQGVDITDRVALERDLRRSEALHRVTLNNMTDTILITDEAGEYTYVCPNVHFIFGYTAAEINAQETIDNLLGPNLFDREELAKAGVLKNIECTVTDKLGREHTLLVNVREVSIQEGTILYSCRDITKRKQREEALTTLQETARDFLYAQTHQEIAAHVVEDTPGVIDLEASGVYLFDADENHLYPAAHSDELDRLHGPLGTEAIDGETLLSYSFVEDEPLFFDDVHEADRLSDRSTGLQSAAYIPLGDHGVFLAGSQERGAFDDVRRELADLLAATAEAAFDRVDRENRLREQDRALQRRNEELTAVNRVNETIREIDQALVEAETREAIDHTVCELLTAKDRFRFAWIGSVDPATDTVVPRAYSGVERGYLDEFDVPVDPTAVEPAGRTAATRTVTSVSNVAKGLREEAWRKHALSRDYLSVLSIPLAYNDLSYGVLTVYAKDRDAFDETSREVFAELGETIASATSAIERKNALLTTSVTRMEFAIDDPSFLITRIAREASCTITYNGGVQQTAEGDFVFLTVEDGPLERVEAAVADLVAIDGVQRVSDGGTGGVIRLRLTQPFLAQELADHGATVQRASATPEETTIEIEVPESASLRQVTDRIHGQFAAVKLRSKRTLDRSSKHSVYSQLLDRLTDRQLEVVQTAYYSGFFDDPRESTGEDVAETLGISATAFYKHIRTVYRKLFSVLFDEAGLTSTATTQ